MRVYGSEKRGGRPIRFFEYHPDRSGKHTAAFLKGFTGCLVTDGYAGYNQVTGVVRCECWAHMHRNGEKPCQRVPLPPYPRPQLDIIIATNFALPDT